MNPLRIGYVTSEITPFAKTGGLADVSGALPARLCRLGHDVRVFVPLYATADLTPADLEPVEGLQDLALAAGKRTYAYSVYRTTTARSDFPVYFIHCPALYGRSGLYTSDPDEPVRFIVLQRAALEAFQRLAWAPDIVHCHDWQTALLPLYLKTIYAWDRLFRDTRTLLTVHNLGYQGIFPSRVLEETGLASCTEHFPAKDLRDGRIGFLRTGLTHADQVTTVSPTYAREIQRPEFGMGLDDVLRKRGDDLVGILNGVDTDVWNPSTDPHLPYRYSAKSLWRKERNKGALLRELGLPYRRGVPVVGMITRLAYQKGIQLLFDPLPSFLSSREVRLVVLASGEPEQERFFTGLERRFPEKVRFWKGFHAELAHLIEAGADLFLMPSIYEPCGLNQMYSRIYGTVPIVRRTGGLADTVELWDPTTGKGSGIVFDHATPDAVRWALEVALTLHADRPVWKKIVANAMDCDFSWEGPARRYVEVYEALLARNGAEVGR